MQQNDSERYSKVIHGATFQKFNFRLRAKADNYNDEQRVRHTIVAVEKVNVESFNRMMIKELKENGGEIPDGVDESKYTSRMDN